MPKKVEDKKKISSYPLQLKQKNNMNIETIMQI